MHSESIEFSLSVSNRTRAWARRAERAHSIKNFLSDSRAADALDAAFDEYSRVDVGSQRVEAPRGDARKMTKELFADIAAQLDILDRQREQLTALLSEAAA